MKTRDLGLMLALDALLEEQNVTRAAARLSIGQPALSAQLARLRCLLNDPLPGRAEDHSTGIADVQVAPTAQADRCSSVPRRASRSVPPAKHPTPALNRDPGSSYRSE